MANERWKPLAWSVQKRAGFLSFSSTVETELRWIYAAFADRSIHPVFSPGGLAMSLQPVRRDGLVQALGWQGKG
jgi:hypothetical protein